MPSVFEKAVELFTAAGGVSDWSREWATAHAVLKSIEWALDAADIDPRTSPGDRLRNVIDSPTTMRELRRKFWQLELDYYASEHDEQWPPPVSTFVNLAQKCLMVDLEVLAVPDASYAPVRFAAPDSDALIVAIEAQREFFDDLEPAAWVIQRCIGSFDTSAASLSTALDCFIGHWGYSRSPRNEWVSLDYVASVEKIISLQRTSLVWSAPSWDVPDRDVAADRAVRFLSCFDETTRFFSNATGVEKSWSFRISDAMFDTGVVMINAQIAGIWWCAEGDRSVPFGVSP